LKKGEHQDSFVPAITKSLIKKGEGESLSRKEGGVSEGILSEAGGNVRGETRGGEGGEKAPRLSRGKAGQ